MTLFDLKAYHLHQERAKTSFHNHNFLFQHVGNELTSRLQDLKKTFKKPLILAPHLLSLEGQHDSNLQEVFPYPAAEYDLILSCLQAHWINDLPQHLKSIHNSLKPEGLYLSALWGGQTLFELRQCFLQAELELMDGASPRIAPFLHPSDAPTLLGKVGFFMPVVDTEKIVVSYPSLLNLLKDLRGMGETNILKDRTKGFTPRKVFEKTEDLYFETFGLKDRRIPATFEVIYLTGWKA
jgi:NADH dehydrogenase [ubiquinone] 1 alpha subcomplex assembly factor 5